MLLFQLRDAYLAASVALQTEINQMELFISSAGSLSRSGRLARLGLGLDDTVSCFLGSHVDAVLTMKVVN